MGRGRRSSFRLRHHDSAEGHRLERCVASTERIHDGGCARSTREVELAERTRLGES